MLPQDIIVADEQDLQARLRKISPWRVIPGVKTFESWRTVPEWYATRDQWLKRGRKVRPKEKPTARWISTVERDSDNMLAGLPVWLDDDDLTLLIEREIPLYHADQTQAVNLQPRTLACLGYEGIFFEPAAKNSFVWWNPEKENPDPGKIGDWETASAWESAQKCWQKGYLTRQLVRQHVNGKKIIGVKAGGKTRHVWIDHDFHGRDRTVFLAQAEVLLNAFHGWGTWHYQVALDDIDGMHYILTFDTLHDLDRATATLRKTLRELDRRHPELAEKAHAAGMRTLGELEIMPNLGEGCRLPLCRGYQMLLDKPLPMVAYRGRQVQDVIGYMAWLNDPERKYMAKEEILDLLWMKLAPAYKGADCHVGKKAANKMPASSIGSMKHCCRQKTTGFWLGTFNPPSSLNAFIMVTARIFVFEAVSQHRAVALLKEYVRAIPSSGWGCSSRLVAQDFRKIDKAIRQKVKRAYSGNGGQGNIELSNEKLEKAVACWQAAGFKLSDKSTWDACWNSFAAVADFAWTEQDLHDIDVYLGPVLGKKHRHLAANVATGMAKMAAVKHASENGMDYGYWEMFLRDEYGVSCGNRKKMAAILKAAKDLGIIAVHSKAIWFSDGRKGFATVYRPGDRVASRIVLSRSAPSDEGGPEGPPRYSPLLTPVGLPTLPQVVPTAEDM